MEKASVKHLDFQLQREKGRSKDLEVECKALHAQIAQLEQDKAGLRREKLMLSEEAKKITKLDERIHLLQKDIENRDAVIASERAAAEQARAETEEVRNNANASIAQWIDAEKQWTEEQTALIEASAQFRNRIEELESTLKKVNSQHADTTRTLDLERDRAKKLAEARDTLETEVRNFHAEAEKLQNKICDLEQTIYKLDVAGDKQRETIDLKETEIRTLETALENERKTVERMELTITSLNDRVNAVKMVSLEEKGVNEKLQCDVNDARKEIARLNLHVESLKRDANFSAQSQASLQKALDEMKEKCRVQQEELKEKSVEIRRHELTISQLNVELKKSENQGGEWSFRNSSLEAELQRTKEALKNTGVTNEALLAEKADLSLKLRQLQSVVDAKDEEMVLMQSHSDERIDVLTKDIRNLENEVAARQDVINDLTKQLNSTSETNAVYQTKILEGSELSEKVRQELAQALSHLHAEEHELYLSRCTAEKCGLFASWLKEWSSFPLTLATEWFTLWQSSQSAAAQLDERIHCLIRKSDQACRVASEQSECLVAKERRIMELEGELTDKTIRVATLQAENGSNNRQIEELREKLDTSTKQIDNLGKEVALLNEQLILKDAVLDEKDALRAEAYSRAGADLSKASCLQVHTLQHCSEQTEILQSLWWGRFEVIRDFFLCTLATWNEERADLTLAKEQAEMRCRELAAFAEEARASMSKDDRAVAEKQESLLSRIACLEGQGARLRREKEQATIQLSMLLRRFEDDRRMHESYKKELQGLLEAERARSISIERDLSKLRSALNYEVSRKCEYKAALEGSKKLLAGSEEMRAADSARALEAIKKANNEAKYWVLCFDRLKCMVERSRKHGKRLPSIDADTIHRLEDAKINFRPMQSQDVNTAVAGPSKLKRLRDEVADAER